MELKEAIEEVKAFIQSTETCFEIFGGNDINMALEKNEYEAIATVFQALEELQKENEKLKEIDLTTVHIKGVCDEKERWRNKIKEKVKELKVKLEDVSKRREKAKEEEKQAVLWCLEIRLDERIKDYEALLKGE